MGTSKQTVHPQVLVVLGAALASRGQLQSHGLQGQTISDTELGPIVLATVHPSSILRVLDSAEQSKARSALTSDMRAAADLAGL